MHSMKQRPESAEFDLLSAEAFIRGENTLSVVSEKPFDVVAARLEASLASYGLAIVQTHDFGPMFAARGTRMDLRVRVYEVFAADMAARLLGADPALAHLLPWRIAMHEGAGVVTVTTPMPAAMVTEFSHAAEVARLARAFEANLQRVLKGVL
jgi:uncharacterized protein (DUF302 family)